MSIVAQIQTRLQKMSFNTRIKRSNARQSKESTQAIGSNDMSVLRPAWLSDDLHAFNHLHLAKVKVKNHFIKSQGFGSKRDLQLVGGGR